VSDQENGVEHDLTVAQNEPIWITSEEAISEVHRYTGRPRSVCVKWIEGRCFSGRLRYEDHGTKQKEDWNHCDPKTGQPFVIVFHLFLVDYNDLMSELDSERKSDDESRPQEVEQESKKLGRPPKHFWPRLYVEAGAWLAHNRGEDETGAQSALAAFLRARATEHGPGLERSQAFEKAKEILDAFRRLRNDGAL
jgi:hypothetical protein